MARRSGLGRGIESLIPSGAGGADGGAPLSGLAELPIGNIRANPNQPRVHFDEEALAELTASVAAIGVLQPVLVRPVDGGYELIAGERRWRAAQRAGLAIIPAIVREVDEIASVEQALVENLHRQDLTPLEEAAAYQQLLEDFSLTHEQVAARVGKSRSAVTNALRLLSLPPSVQQLLAEGRLSAGHAKAILGTPDRALQERLAKRAVSEQWSVRAVEQAIRSAQPGGSGRASRPTALRAPGIVELEHLLGEHLSTTVSVNVSGKRGKVTIDFADLEDLERIYRVMVEGPPTGE